MMTKDEKIGHVSLLILKEMTKVKHPKLNIQKLALKTNVSRAWIYKYFGSSNDEIILTAIDFIAPQITELSRGPAKITTKKEWGKEFLKSLEKTLIKSEEYPEIFEFYFLISVIPSKYSKRVQLHKSRYMEEKMVPLLVNIFHFTPSEARYFTELSLSLRLGLVQQWMQTSNKMPIARNRLIDSVKKNIFDQFKV